ncbi:DNA-binding transcriptional repressor DeoR [Thorsellia kenyensis]|uniref:DNA-binding transcriptional repressor DeoR n=1 Tax=Thorsellia kenyensis TaxID=1549888 RepID=A0ABV6CBI3_9GAMM
MDIRRKFRIDKLVNALQNQDKMKISEAAALLDVSEMTIRRDINSDQKLLKLLGGYIVCSISLNQSQNNFYFLSEQENKNVAAKRNIAKKAATLVNANDTIFFDSGTTIPFIIHEIDDSLPFTAICYSLHAFLALKQKPNCRVILCGGDFKSSSHVFIPTLTHNEISSIYTNKAFISAAGVCVAKGVTTWVIDEVKVKQMAMDNTEYSILVVDDEKFDKVRPGYFARLDEFDALITNLLTSTDISHYLSQSHIQVDITSK